MAEGGRGEPFMLSRRAFLGSTAAMVAGLGSSVGGRSAGAQRSEPPKVTVTIPASDVASGNILLTPFSLSYPSGPMIIDNDGNVAWFRPYDGFTTNLQVQRYLGEPVLTWWQGNLVLPAGYGLGEGVIMNALGERVATVEAGNGLKADLHDFVLTPQGTALITAFEEHPFDLSSIGGPRDGKILDSIVQEVEVASGKVVAYWRASHHVEVSESYLAVPTSPSEPYDFFHVNSVALTLDGNLLISGRHTWCVYKVRRTTGQILWRLHGKRSDWHMGRGTRFQWQHDAREHSGGVLSLFDDGGKPAPKQSRGLLLSLDESSMRATLVHGYPHHPRLFAANQGSTQILGNGDVFVGWGSQPYFTEYSQSGQVRFEGRLPDHVSSYRAFRAEWPPVTN